MEHPKYLEKNNGLSSAIIIAITIMLLYLFMSSRTTLWDRDEPRYARVTVEMVESGNYLVPTFNGESWLDKPIMMYWLMSLPVRIFGPTEFACRFFSAIGTAITCFLTFMLGRQLFNAKTGLLAMVILASNCMFLTVGTSAISDAILLPFIVGVILIFITAIKNSMRTIHIILMGIGLGLGMLTKGPMGLFPLFVIFPILWLNRKSISNIKYIILKICGSILIGFLILAAWAIPVNNATNGEFISVFLGHHVFARALRPMENHGGNILLYLPYYIPIIIGGLFPWTIFLPGSVSALLRSHLGGREIRNIMTGWIVPIVVLMSLAATKLPHYIIFTWPAFALCIAATIVASQEKSLSEKDIIWLGKGNWFFSPIAACGVLAFTIGVWFIPFKGMQWPALASGIVLLIMSIIAIKNQLNNRFSSNAIVLLAGMIAFHIPLIFGIFPAIEKIKLSPQAARIIKENTSNDTPVVTYKFGEPTLNFYVGRHIEPLPSEQHVRDWFAQHESGVLVIPEKYFLSTEEKYGKLNLNLIATVDGFNYSKGDILKLLVLKKENNE